VEGKIRSRTYDDANGMKRYVNEIYADNLELLGSRRREGTENNEQPPYPPVTSGTATHKSLANNNNSADEDDLPF
jgi:single-strand DNA-binding protein